METDSQYRLRHKRYQRMHGRAASYLCEGGCGATAQQWATVHGRIGYKLYADIVPLCQHCHRLYDITEETRQKMSAAHRRRWAEPEYRERLSAAQRKRYEDDPAERAKTGGHTRQLWANPEYRSKVVAAQKAAWARRRTEKAPPVPPGRGLS